MADRDGRSRIDELIEATRHSLPHRPTPPELPALIAEGALVIDTRPAHQRDRDGELPGALVIDRNVLEWRLDPTSDHRIVDIGAEQPVIVVCSEGYASTLAAAALQQLGMRGATDLDGGYQAWRAWAGRR